MHHYARGPSPAPPAHEYSRAASPAPPMHYHGRGPSPAPRQGYLPRAISPAPPAHDYMRAASPAPPPPHHAHSRGPSPAPSFGRHSSFNVHDDDDSPPPPPPPHRHAAQKPSADFEDTPYALSRHGSNGSFAPYNPYVMSRNGSNASFNPDLPLSRNGSSASHREHQEEPKTPGHEQYRASSPAGSHMTPSPLREAMDGVMEQLDELSGYSGHDEKGSPTKAVDLWSPESFDLANVDEGYETWSGESSQEASLNGGQKEKGGLPKLNTYVARMENQFQKMHKHSLSTPAAAVSDMPPPPPPKGQLYDRPKSSMGGARHGTSSDRQLGSRKSAYDVGRGVGRTYTTKTNTTEQSHTSSSTQSSDRTLWSGESAGGFSATSAGSLARNAPRPQSALGMRHAEPERPETPFTGVTYHSSHASNYQANKQSPSQPAFQDDTTAGLGGLVQPKAPRRNIFKKIFESAKTGVASGRAGISGTTMGSMDSAKSSPLARSLTSGTPTMLNAGTLPRARDSVRETGPGSGVDWVQVRRDVNRSNSLSQNERLERHERCQMLDHPTLNPVDELYQCVEGDEGADGNAVADPVNYHAINLSQVDKNSRFIAGLPPTITAITLATTYICRPYKSDVQRLRAIFTWVSEKICWEEDFEGEIDTRQVIQSKRACAEEYAVLVQEMCSAIGVECEIIRGYLKIPGEVPDLNMMPRSNHWWNAVIVDGEWRLVDCCLASPSNPRRSDYSSAANNTADFWYFLTRPVELCWTHVPEHHDQQHIVPPVAHETLLNLPCASPTFFRQGIEMVDYSTSLNRIEDLEMVHIKFNVPPDVEIAAEVEARAYTRDTDGDVFESGDVVKKRALAQAEWFNGVKKYTVKALLPGDEGQGTLKIYAGKRGLMHSIKDIPHPLAFSVPIIHTGENPPYNFVTRHPTPHAQRHDIYVVQPQCQRLALNNTFVFAIRQHPSSLGNGPHSSLTPASNPGSASPVPFARPSSAMSMNASTSGTMSNPSSASGTVAGKKPAKLAIQTPGGKILRLMRKEDRKGISVGSRGFSMEDEAATARHEACATDESADMNHGSMPHGQQQSYPGQPQQYPPQQQYMQQQSGAYQQPLPQQPFQQTYPTQHVQQQQFQQPPPPPLEYPSQQLPFNYSNFPQQQQPQHQQNAQWNQYNTPGSYQAGQTVQFGQQMAGAQGYMPPNNAWQDQQQQQPLYQSPQQGFYQGSSPQMMQQNAIPQSQPQPHAQEQPGYAQHLQPPKPRTTPSPQVKQRNMPSPSMRQGYAHQAQQQPRLQARQPLTENYQQSHALPPQGSSPSMVHQTMKSPAPQPTTSKKPQVIRVGNGYQQSQSPVSNEAAHTKPAPQQVQLNRAPAQTNVQSPSPHQAPTHKFLSPGPHSLLASNNFTPAAKSPAAVDTAQFVRSSYLDWERDAQSKPQKPTEGQLAIARNTPGPAGEQITCVK
ncbi:cytokinesis protein-like protein [Emericellopsis cladophorae]|uniref:Cytokinesis protein-like protein n=1 Tax=Emericellopsis cladophorae TaxID=2686198 RepID=A0A9Q0BFN0_9HYPO|nr:cytokinesis protein-like protein [Emericellopsis cladophorae]KAI6782464.1 cytokinesis protein-like protein [Emericellopsis cladophorae]